jgi:hypothetical protein
MASLILERFAFQTEVFLINPNLADVHFSLERRRDEDLDRVHLLDLLQLLFQPGHLRTERWKAERLDKVLVVWRLLQKDLEGLVERLTFGLGDEGDNLEAAFHLGGVEALVAANVQLWCGEAQLGRFILQSKIKKNN